MTKLRPGAISPEFDGELVDALPQADVLTNPHDVKLCSAWQIKDNVRRCYRIIGRPISKAIAVQKVFRTDTPSFRRERLKHLQ